MQEEGTRSEEIWARESVEREKIADQRDFLLKELDMMFEERPETFRPLFDSLDDAIEE